MRLREDDICFLKLDGREFEEMCFDLLRQLGFHSIVWRQRGSDQGRDIEGSLTSANPLVGASTERWFFECKNQAAGVSVTDLADKIAWADGEKPDYFVILAGSHLTNDCRSWLDKIRTDKRYRIHAVEGKDLNQLLLGYPKLVERYFAGPYALLLRDMIRQFLLVGVLPSPEQIYSVWANLDPFGLAPEELAFLWSAWRMKKDEVDAWSEDHTEFSCANYLSLLLEQARPGRFLLEGKVRLEVMQLSTKSRGLVFEVGPGGKLGKVVGPAPRTGVLDSETVAQIMLESANTPSFGLYSYVAAGESCAIEVLVEGGHSLTTSLRRITGEFDTDQNTALNYLKKSQSREIWRTP